MVLVERELDECAATPEQPDAPDRANDAMPPESEPGGSDGQRGTVWLQYFMQWKENQGKPYR